MNEEVVLRGTVGNLISQIENLVDPDKGIYILYAPAQIAHLEANMPAAVILESRYSQEGDPLPEYAQAHQLEPAIHVSLAQDVILSAKEQKPTITVAELIEALNYFLAYDAFMDFDNHNTSID